MLLAGAAAGGLGAGVAEAQTEPAKPGIPASAPRRAAARVDAPNSTAAKAPSEQAENITVSANKRRQRTRDVAGSVTVLTGRQLQALGAQSYGDYLRLAPGAVFSEGIPGLSTASFRGITDTNLLDQGQGTTGYFLNDIPLAEPGFAIAIPDIDTFDVARVEVLRGPQSTLFGSSTLGGAIDYIANTADTHRYDAAAETSILGVDGGDVGYTEKGMVNIPIIRDELAVRGVLEYRQDPGYINNITTGEKGSNQDVIRNARVSDLRADRRHQAYLPVPRPEQQDIRPGLLAAGLRTLQQELAIRRAVLHLDATAFAAAGPGARLRDTDRPSILRAQGRVSWRRLHRLLRGRARLALALYRPADRRQQVDVL